MRTILLTITLLVSMAVHSAMDSVILESLSGNVQSEILNNSGKLRYLQGFGTYRHRVTQDGVEKRNGVPKGI